MVHLFLLLEHERYFSLTKRMISTAIMIKVTMRKVMSTPSGGAKSVTSHKVLAPILMSADSAPKKETNR